MPSYACCGFSNKFNRETHFYLLLIYNVSLSALPWFLGAAPRKPASSRTFAKGTRCQLHPCWWSMPEGLGGFESARFCWESNHGCKGRIDGSTWQHHRVFGTGSCGRNGNQIVWEARFWSHGGVCQKIRAFRTSRGYWAPRSNTSLGRISSWRQSVFEEHSVVAYVNKLFDAFDPSRPKCHVHVQSVEPVFSALVCTLGSLVPMQIHAGFEKARFDTRGETVESKRLGIAQLLSLHRFFPMSSNFN